MVPSAVRLTCSVGKAERLVGVSVACNLAKLKSSSLAPLLVSMMLPDFRSRCTTAALKEPEAATRVTVLGDQQVIGIIAGNDGVKVPGKKKPEITVKANSVVRLRMTAEQGEAWRKDQVVHTFTIKELIDQGWHLILTEGTHEFTLTAVPQPGLCIGSCHEAT